MCDSLRIFELRPEIKEFVEVLRYKGHQDTVFSAVFHHSSDLLLSGSYDGSVKLYCFNRRRSSLEALATSTGHGAKVRLVEFSPRDRLAVSASIGGGVILMEMDPEAGRLDKLDQWQSKKGNPPYSVNFSPDGKHLLVGLRSGEVVLLSLECAPS